MEKSEKEIDPVDEILIDDENIFGRDDEKVKKPSDFFFKYLKPFYRLFIHIIPEAFRSLKGTLQRITRKHHCADVDLWNLAFAMGPGILRKLKAFRDYQGKHGNSYPSYFSEWGYEGCTDEYGGIGMLKADYEKAQAEGRFGGGGFEAWLAALDEMIFAFEYRIYHDSEPHNRNHFFQKWNLKDPWRETDDNLSWSYNFKKSGGTRMSCCDANIEKINQLKSEGWIPVNKHRVYIDSDLLNQYEERVRKGMQLFGKFYWDLWD